MTEIGEGIAIPRMRMKQKDTCIFCGKAEHEFPKRDKIKATGWKRKKISGVGGNFESKKKNLYPNQKSPPSVYRSEGHHCLAFSSFIVDARNSPKDRFAALNHYLKEEGYDPNNMNNRIDLPGRKTKDDDDLIAQFKEFEKAVVASKPLQLHIGGHADEFMSASNVMIRDICNALKDGEWCDEPDDSFKEVIMKKIEQAEDKAFKKTAGAISPWICHPVPLRDAEAYVMEKRNLPAITYPKL